MNARAKQNYQRFSDRYKRVAKERHTQLKAMLNEEKNKPCADCGARYPPYAMDFDHVRGEKFRDVSEMFRRRFAWSKIKAEIDKCELVCATCHRLRTLARRQVQK